MSSVAYKTRRQIQTRGLQRGAVLIVSLLMLLVMTLIGVTGVQVTSLEEKMAGNTRDRNLAFQSAEAALRAAESVIAAQVEANTLGTFESSFSTNAPYFQAGTTLSADLLKGDDDSLWASAAAYAGSLENVSEAPRYVIQRLTAADPKQHFFRITARAKGGSTNAIVVLQSLYEVDEP